MIFSNYIDASTVTSDTLRVKRLDGVVEYDVPGKYVVYNDVVFYVPDSTIPLQQFTYYTVEITGGVKDTGGTPYTITFRTAWVEGTVTYYGNGNDGRTVPVDTNTYGQNATVTVLGNTGSLTKSGYMFAGWNTAADCTGTTYNEGDTFNISTVGPNFYARWTPGSLGADMAQWAQTVTTGNDVSRFVSVSVALDGSVYVAGEIYGTGTYNFGNGVITTGPYSNYGVLLVKYNDSGIAQCMQTVTGGGLISEYRSVSVASDGSVYTAGRFGGGTDPYNFGNNITATGAYGSGYGLLVKYQ